jgi:hypothetical protein
MTQQFYFLKEFLKKISDRCGFGFAQDIFRACQRPPLSRYVWFKFDANFCVRLPGIRSINSAYGRGRGREIRMRDRRMEKVGEREGGKERGESGCGR